MTDRVMWLVRFTLGAICVLLAGILMAGPAYAVAPDGRAYELVSSPDKNEGLILNAMPRSDGDQVQYAVSGALDGGGLSSPSLAVRTSSGWQSHSLLPRSDQRLMSGYTVTARTPDFATFVAYTSEGLLAPSFRDIVTLDQSSNQTLLASGFAPPFGLLGTADVLVSNNGQHVFANLLRSFDPGHGPFTMNVYDLATDPPTLVSRMPDNSVSPCGVAFATSGFIGRATTAQHWISTDGSRVFFRSSGPLCGPEPPQIYMRDLDAGTTTLISGPPVTGPTAEATFLQASEDGSQVIFATAASLTPGDSNGHPDIYRYTQGSGTDCLTCVTSDADVAPDTDGTFDLRIAVSEDLTHVYFVSQQQLAPGATAGVDNLYLLVNNTLTYVSPAPEPPSSGDGGTALANIPGKNSALTPDGEVLVFASRDPAMDAMSGRVNGGFLQYYRYDHRDRSMTCISCPADKPASADVLSVLSSAPVPSDYGRPMTADGNLIFFTSGDSLVPGDVSPGNDIYEWHNGAVAMLSTATSDLSLDTHDRFISTTPDGRDAFFVSLAHLTHNVRDNSTQLYDARIGGGFPAPQATPQCSGDACKSPPHQNPAFDEAATATTVLPASHAGTTRHRRLALLPLSPQARAGLRATGVLQLRVQVNAAGTVAISARTNLKGRAVTLATARRHILRAGVVKVNLRLSRRARQNVANSRRLSLVVALRLGKEHVARRITI